jgi:hypothetical protein
MAFSCGSGSISYKVGATAEKRPAPRNRGGGNTGIAMIRSLFAVAAIIIVSGPVHAASAVNLDSEPRTLLVTEGGSKSELALGAGETVEFCAGGCFVTMPNGDIEALTGNETIEISGGVARIK